MGGLSLWFLTLQYIFLKKRHLVLAAAQEGLAKMTSRIIFGFLHWFCLYLERHSAAPCLEGSLCYCLQPGDIGDTCPYVPRT